MAVLPLDLCQQLEVTLIQVTIVLGLSLQVETDTSYIKNS